MNIEAFCESPGPGVYRDLPFDVYRKIKAVNNTRLSLMQRSPLHYDQNTFLESTPAMQFGRLAHATQLEPQWVADLYVVMPDLTQGIVDKKPTATKEYKQRVARFQEQNADREIVDADQFQRSIRVVQALAGNERAREYLSGGERELTVIWRDPETCLLCKARLDHYKPGRVTDLKTTEDASRFKYAIDRYRYHRQSAFYFDGAKAAGLEIDEFCLVAVENQEPFDVRAAPVSRDMLHAGRAEYRGLLNQIAECERVGSWPGCGNPDAWETSFYTEEEASQPLLAREVPSA